jgi:flagellar capping protein FliD
MATSGISFQGITSGLQTDQLVAAIMAQEGLPLQHLKDRQTLNTQRSTALKTMQTDMMALATSMQTLQYTGSGFNARTVSS